MRRLSKNKYQGTKFAAVPKHINTFEFHPGNKVVEAELDRVPAYHSSGLKTYVRKFPKARNEKVLNVPLLCTMIKKIVPQNDVSGLSDGLLINGIKLILTEGLATVTGKVKFRFTDLRDLLSNLAMDGILGANKYDVKEIKYWYNETLKEDE